MYHRKQALLAGGKAPYSRRRLHQLRSVCSGRGQYRDQQFHGIQVNVMLLLAPVADDTVLDATQCLHKQVGSRQPSGRQRCGGHISTPQERCLLLPTLSSIPVLLYPTLGAQPTCRRLAESSLCSLSTSCCLATSAMIPERSNAVQRSS